MKLESPVNGNAKHSVAALLALSTLSFAADLRSQVPPEEPRISARQNIEPELLMILVKREYRLGEPIKVVAELRNSGEGILERVPPPEVEFLRLELRRQGEAEWQSLNSAHGRTRFDNLNSGDSLYYVYDLHMHNGKWLVAEPGKYEVRMSYSMNPHERSPHWQQAITEIEIKGDQSVKRGLSELFKKGSSLSELGRLMDGGLLSPTAQAYLNFVWGRKLAVPRYDPVRNVFAADHAAAVERFRASLATPGQDDALLLALSAEALRSSLREIGKSAQEISQEVRPHFERARALARAASENQSAGTENAENAAERWIRTRLNPLAPISAGQDAALNFWKLP